MTFGLVGERFKSILTFIPDTWFDFIENKRVQYLGFAFLLGVNLINMVSSTGAFEVYLNDRLIFSKLATGYMPSFDFIASHL